MRFKVDLKKNGGGITTPAENCKKKSAFLAKLDNFESFVTNFYLIELGHVSKIKIKEITSVQSK